MRPSQGLPDEDGQAVGSLAADSGGADKRRSVGLMGGAPHRRNRDGVHDHDLLLVGLRVRRADASNHVRWNHAGVALVIYRVLRLDRVHQYGYVVCEEGSETEKRVDLVPTIKQRPEHVLLQHSTEVWCIKNAPNLLSQSLQNNSNG